MAEIDVATLLVVPERDLPTFRSTSFPFPSTSINELPLRFILTRIVENLLCIEEDDADSVTTGVDRPEEWYVAASVGRMCDVVAEYVKLCTGAGRL
jgi:hypothetical protein